MDISDRKQKILKAIIDSYIETAEPVGSKAITGRSGLQLSSATIRNEMAELENMGYLEQPHTSAGRIPSPTGYGLYVFELMRRQALSVEETERINVTMRQKMNELDHLLSEVSRLLSRLLDYPIYSLKSVSPFESIQRFELIYLDQSSFIAVLMPNSKTVKNKVFRLPHDGDEQSFRFVSTLLNKRFGGLPRQEYSAELVSSAVASAGSLGGVVSLVVGYAIELLEESSQQDVHVTGATTLLKQPEYQDVSKAHRILDYLSEEERLAKIPAPEAREGIKITIGPENLADELQDSSVVVVSYDIGDSTKGLIGVVGPTRMDYANVSSRLAYLAEALGRVLRGEPPSPPRMTGHKDT